MNRWTIDPTNRRKIVLTVNQEKKVATCDTAGAAALILHRMSNYGPLVEALKIASEQLEEAHTRSSDYWEENCVATKASVDAAIAAAEKK